MLVSISLRHEEARTNKRYRLSEDEFKKIALYDALAKDDVAETLLKENNSLRHQLAQAEKDLEKFKRENEEMARILSQHVPAPHMLPFSPFKQVKKEQ